MPVVHGSPPPGPHVDREAILATLQLVKTPNDVAPPQPPPLLYRLPVTWPVLEASQALMAQRPRQRALLSAAIIMFTIITLSRQQMTSLP